MDLSHNTTQDKIQPRFNAGPPALVRSLPDWLLAAAFLLSTAWATGCGSDAPSGGIDASRDSGDATEDAQVSPDAADAAPCTTVLCGTPPVCCGDDEECVEDQCLPTCSSGVRCGEDLSECCQEGQVCMAGACVTPGDPCHDSYDCQQPGEFCEPTLGKCLPQPDPVTCEIVPDFETLNTTIEWSNDTDEIISIPVVADLDGDGNPEVVVNTTREDNQSWMGGDIVVLDGRNGTEKVRITEDPAQGSYGSHGRSTIAVGDVSGDGLPDIVYATRTLNGQEGGASYIVAVDGQGNRLWVSHDRNDTLYSMRVVNAAITLANLDNDPEAEVVIGAIVLDNDGLVVFDAGATPGEGASFGTNRNYYGGISAVADLDGDGYPEIVSGKNAWRVHWQPGPHVGDPPLVTLTQYWTHAGPDGYPAIADLDGDGTPEVVLVAEGTVRVLSGQTGLLWCGIDPTDAACQADSSRRTQPLPIPMPANGNINTNRGGPPTIADFDGDGRPEIGVAGGYSYSVYDVNRPGEEVVQPSGDPPPQPGAIFVRWSSPTQDLSSNATGSSVFDFQGDGTAEVVYADECYLRVYSGADGTVELEQPNRSATIHEYPLVVDVDGDGNSEILMVANADDQFIQCPHSGNYRGIFAIGDANDEWVPTRRVWTQHTYHVTNATSDGNVPVTEQDNWTTAGLNNYRQNAQGAGVFNAPDLSVDLTAGLSRCSIGEIQLQARVTNVGALGVAPGINVDFYQGTGQDATLLGSGQTTQALLPGTSEVVTLTVPSEAEPTTYSAVVDGTNTVAECNDDNNDDLATDIQCPVVQ